MDIRFEIVEAAKHTSHRSWINLRNAIYCNSGLPCKFSTDDVKRTSIGWLRKIVKDSGMRESDILTEMDRRRLGM